MLGKLLIAMAMVAFSVSDCAEGAEVKIEGVLKTVNAEERTIILERTTNKGAKEVELEVATEAGDLSSLKEGDEVTITYDSKLEVVTQIISAQAESIAPQIVALTELGTAGHPWVTKNGLTIFFTVKESQGLATIWTAKRESVGTLFKDKKQVSLGQDNTFSEDGLEGIVFLPEEGKGTLQSIKRKSLTEDFGRPTLIKELGWKQLGDRTTVTSPGLSADRLELYCEVSGKGPCVSTRSKVSDPWSKPKKLPIVSGGNRGQRFPYVTDDGLWLFCTDRRVGDPPPANIALYGRAKKTEPFVFKGHVKAGDTSVMGEFPRYIASTRELFFVKTTDNRSAIYVIKNFDPTNVTVEE